jgi:cytochrome c peroxidase
LAFVTVAFAPCGLARADEPHVKPDVTPQVLKTTLGRILFHDTALSKPRGMACATCHAAGAGFTYPESDVNLALGCVEGIVKGRFGNRKPPTISYAALLPQGPPTYDPDLTAFAGGLFWDGRAADLVEQAQQPFLNPNEMNNLVHNLADPAEVVSAVEAGHKKLFERVFGKDVFSHPTNEVYVDIAEAIAAFEASDQVSPFTSKYDAYVAGRAKFTRAEHNGLILFTGSTTGRPGERNRNNSELSDLSRFMQTAGY